MTDMTSSTSAPSSRGLRDVIAQISARLPRRFDPLGLVSGYRMYVIYTNLSSRSDRELADLGIARADIASFAASQL